MKWKHKLSNIDLEALVGDCENCGPKSILVIKDSRPKCKVGRYEQGHSYRAKRITGTCPICLTEAKLVRDHNHDCCDTKFEDSCGQCFRGSICSACNSGLGFFKDSSASLARAIHYLNMV